MALVLEVGSVPAVSWPSSHARFGWDVSSYLDASGLDVKDGDERVRVVASHHAAEEVRVAGRFPVAADTVGEKAWCPLRGQVLDDAGDDVAVREPSLVDSDVGAEPVRSMVPAVAVAGSGHMGTVVKEGWRVWSMG